MKKNRVKEKITFLMYKVEIKFREDKIESESAKLLCEQIDRIFEKEDLKCSGSHLERRRYNDKGRKDDYGRFWVALFGLKDLFNVAEFLEECFWYNGNDKEDLLKDFIKIH